MSDYTRWPAAAKPNKNVCLESGTKPLVASSNLPPGFTTPHHHPAKVSPSTKTLHLWAQPNMTFMHLDSQTRMSKLVIHDALPVELIIKILKTLVTGYRGPSQSPDLLAVAGLDHVMRGIVLSVPSFWRSISIRNTPESLAYANLLIKRSKDHPAELSIRRFRTTSHALIEEIMKMVIKLSSRLKTLNIEESHSVLTSLLMPILERTSLPQLATFAWYPHQPVWGNRIVTLPNAPHLNDLRLCGAQIQAANSGFPRLRSLFIKSCNISATAFAALVTSADSLEHLQIERCNIEEARDEASMTELNFPELKSLTLKECDAFLFFQLLVRLKTPQLETVTLTKPVNWFNHHNSQWRAHELRIFDTVHTITVDPAGTDESGFLEHFMMTMGYLDILTSFWHSIWTSFPNVTTLTLFPSHASIIDILATLQVDHGAQKDSFCLRGLRILELHIKSARDLTAALKLIQRRDLGLVGARGSPILEVKVSGRRAIEDSTIRRIIKELEKYASVQCQWTEEV